MIYAFETWFEEDEQQVSPLYTGEEAKQFIDNHYNEGRTDKNLHEFNDLIEATDFHNYYLSKQQVNETF